MPFDVSAATRPAAAAARPAVAVWLFALCAMVLVMIALGGATRLTGSGLSIMEWAPLLGALPPWSDAEWQRLFALYQQIPQYSLLHEGFGLAGFKQIFWLEWVHRLWGRLMGLALAGPLLWFWWRGAIDRRLGLGLLLILLLGGLQGAVGWFMVASGFLPDSTSVSAYRLVVHLVMAVTLYAAMLWLGLSLLPPAPPQPACPPRRLLALSAGLTGLTIVAGGFVAGTHAGLIYNTFPLMDGRVVPVGYLSLAPWPRNLTENVAAVQFDHRLLATLAAITIAATAFHALRQGAVGRLRTALAAMLALVAAQYALGVATLLWAVPVALATAHQVTAILLLTACLVSLHAGIAPSRRTANIQDRVPNSRPRQQEFP